MEKLSVQDLAMFIGCECKIIERNNIPTYQTQHFAEVGEIVIIDPILLMSVFQGYFLVKPMLRPVSDITDEEKKEIFHLVFKKSFPNTGSMAFFYDRTYSSEPRWILHTGVERLAIEMNGKVWADSDLEPYKINPNIVAKWFLSKHFDVFGWIEKGFAIDKTKV